MRVERVVLDTNVLISAALFPLGKPFASLSWVLDNAAFGARHHGSAIIRRREFAYVVRAPDDCCGVGHYAFAVGGRVSWSPLSDVTNRGDYAAGPDRLQLVSDLSAALH